MFEQMNIFDFIEEPEQAIKLEHKTMFEELFTKINDPVFECANCLCEHCANNAEWVWHKIKPVEVQTPCFNCDECRYYTGNSVHGVQRKAECEEFIISEHAAASRRKKIKIIK